MSKANKKRKLAPEPYYDVCVLQYLGNICHFNKQNCKVSISVGLSEHKMHPYNVFSSQ